MVVMANVAKWFWEQEVRVWLRVLCMHLGFALDLEDCCDEVSALGRFDQLPYVIYTNIMASLIALRALRALVNNGFVHVSA